MGNKRYRFWRFATHVRNFAVPADRFHFVCTQKHSSRDHFRFFLQPNITSSNHFTRSLRHMYFVYNIYFKPITFPCMRLRSKTTTLSLKLCLLKQNIAIGLCRLYSRDTILPGLHCNPVMSNSLLIIHTEGLCLL